MTLDQTFDKIAETLNEVCKRYSLTMHSVLYEINKRSEYPTTCVQTATQPKKLRKYQLDHKKGPYA
jgi:hypothetical protein